MLTSTRRLVTAVLIAVALVAWSGRMARAASPAADYAHASWTDFGDPLQPPGVYAITQDEQRYLWLGLLNGLVRFDGSQFVRWEALGRPALPERSVTALASGRDGSLWIGYGNLGGISRFRHGSIQHFTARDGVPAGAIRTLLVSPDDEVWAVGYGGIARFAGDHWEVVRDDRGTPIGAVQFVYQDDEGTIWVATPAGRHRRRTGTRHLERLPTTTAVSSFFGDRIASTLSRSRQPLTLVSSNPTMPPHALTDPQGRLWAAAESTLVVVDPGLPPAEAVVTLTSRGGLSSSRVNTLFRDVAGQIWVGTPVGLDLFQQRGADQLRSVPGIHAPSLAVLADRDELWVGTTDGLVHLKNGRSTQVTGQAGLPGSRISALHRDAAGTLWVATDRGLRWLRGQTLQPVPGTAGSLANVSSIATDLDGGLWLCQFGALHRFSGTTPLDLEQVPALAGQRAGVVFSDSHGTVWVGLWNGSVVRYHHGQFTTFRTADGLPAGRIISLSEDSSGALWVGSLGGLSRMTGDRIDTPGSASGLAGLMVVSIHRDAANTLWLGTLSGLVRVTIDEFEAAVRSPQYRPRLRIFDPPPDVSFAAIGQPMVASTPDGTLWLPSTQGLVSLDARRVTEVDAPRVFTNGIAVDDQPTATESAVRVPAGSSRVRVDFSAVAFGIRPRVAFRYRLDGFDADWVDAGTTRQAVYTSLPPGEYRFRVAASVDGSPWRDTSLPVPIRILPAFYRTPWFYGGTTGLLALVLYAAWRTRVRRLQSEYSAVLAERARLGREIHDTLLQGMVGVALQVHSILDRASLPDDVSSRLARARDTLEHYIRETRNSIWDLRSPTLERLSLVDAVRMAGDTLTADSGATFTLDVLGTPLRGAPQVEAHLLRIAHEAISNAVRHGRATHVHVDLAYREEGVRVVVTDNGRGFDATSSVHRSAHQWGLATMRERAQQIGAEFRCESGPTGTTVEASAPLPLAS